jgi:hypothetical protein
MQPIMTFDNLIEATVCSEIIRKFDCNPNLVPGTTGAGFSASHKQSIDLDLPHDREWNFAVSALSSSLDRAISVYAAQNESFGSLRKVACSEFRLRKYDAGGFFDWHIDSYDYSVCTRVLACIWYLNDVPEGGSTEFLHQSVEVPPKMGRLLVFPTSFEYVHRSAPVRIGRKYIAVGFLEHVMLDKT